MKILVLLTWITLIVVLDVAAGSNESDYAGLCEKCDEVDTYPECSMDHSILQLNLTIHCQKSLNSDCAFGIVQTVEEEGSNNITAFVCKLKLSSLDLLVNELENDHIQVVSVVDEQQTAEITTKREMDSPFDEHIGTNAEGGMQTVITAKLPAVTAITVNDENILHNTEHTYTDVSPPVADGHAISVATPTSTTESIQPNSSIGMETPLGIETEATNAPDYLGDEPNEEMGIVAGHNEESGMESNALSVEPMKQTGNIVEGHTSPVSEMTSTRMTENTIEITTLPNFYVPMKKCFACSSNKDSNCVTKPEKQIDCKATGGSRSGCYTLYKADSNTTTRGCISELTEEGMNFCKNKTKTCTLCYDHGCNNQLAKSEANNIIKYEVILVIEMLFVAIFYL